MYIKHMAGRKQLNINTYYEKNREARLQYQKNKNLTCKTYTSAKNSYYYQLRKLKKGTQMIKPRHFKKSTKNTYIKPPLSCKSGEVDRILIEFI